MRLKASFLVLLLLTALALNVKPARGKTKAPGFEVVDITGQPFALSAHLGKIVVIDFFWTTCPPCISEIQHLKTLYDRYPPDQVVIVSIDVAPVEPTDDYLRDFAQQYGMQWIVARDTDQVGDRYAVSAGPTLFVVGPEGYYSTAHVGLTPAAELISEIDAFYITILSPQDREYTASVVPLNFTISQPAAWIGYSLDGHDNVTISGNTSLTDLAEGTHEVVVYFREEGGTTVHANTVQFSIDTATQQTGPPYKLIAIIVGASIVALLVGLVIAGHLLGWSEHPKKRRKRSH
jgi:thiol-disulfide isomerase/thioredoxin